MLKKMSSSTYLGQCNQGMCADEFRARIIQANNNDKNNKVITGNQASQMKKKDKHLIEINWG